MKAFAVFVDLNDISMHESRLGDVVGSNKALRISGESYVTSHSLGYGVYHVEILMIRICSPHFSKHVLSSFQ